MTTNKPKKHFGQNFLNSDVILKKIIEKSGITNKDHVIEIGPGRGALTKYLVKHAKTLSAFEIDTDLKQYLNPIISENQHFNVYYKDILDVDLDAFIDEHQLESVKVVANIPYYITSPIIFKLLETTKVTDMTLLIQKEVADRLSSEPNSKDYAAVTVIIRALASVTKLIQVKRTAFYPAPNVDSTVIQITKNNTKDRIKDEVLFKELVKAAFKQKRKTLLNNLSEYTGLDKPTLLEKLKNIDPNYNQFTRAESISIDGFIELSNRWQDAT